MAKLTAADGDFGFSANIVVIGAHYAGNGGALYVFRTTNGVPRRSCWRQRRASGDGFGARHRRQHACGRIRARARAGAIGLGLRLPHDRRRRHVRPGGQADSLRCGPLRLLRGERGHRVIGACGDDDGSSLSLGLCLHFPHGWHGGKADCRRRIAACAWRSGDTVVVGADGNDNDTGAGARVFRTSDGWRHVAQVTKLTASDAAAGDWSASLAIDGDTVVIGARYDDDAGSQSGSAYVFRHRSGDYIPRTEADSSPTTIS